MGSFREPVHVPSAQPFDIFDYDLKGFEVQSRNSIKAYIEQDQGPFEERIDCVS